MNKRKMTLTSYLSPSIDERFYKMLAMEMEQRMPGLTVSVQFDYARSGPASDVFRESQVDVAFL
jgi:hypothetical protein